ncbi:uncharacterized protein BDW70DRAFT_142999, partial [Aspergillus foveolatus]|uniref:uncharacterized protein n=1 Tax=Aspergillus foveolatus TaxID=210207 RepID=UPI003CCE2ECF
MDVWSTASWLVPLSSVVAETGHIHVYPAKVMQYPLRNQLFNGYLFQAFLFCLCQICAADPGSLWHIGEAQEWKDGIVVNIITLSTAFMNINLRHLTVDAFWEIA